MSTLHDENTSTQQKQILEHLKSGNSITPLEALSRFNCMRLSARICSLKKDGYSIKSQKVLVTSGKRVAMYSMSA